MQASRISLCPLQNSFKQCTCKLYEISHLYSAIQPPYLRSLIATGVSLEPPREELPKEEHYSIKSMNYTLQVLLLRDSLVIRERISADTPVEKRCRIRVLSYRAEIEDPEILSVAIFQEFLHILSPITIDTFRTRSWETHYDYMVRQVY